MQIHSTLFFFDISFIWALLLIISGDCFRKHIEFQIAIVVFIVILLRTDFPNICFCKTQRTAGATQKLHVVFVQRINVVLAVISAVNHQLYLLVPKHVKFTKQFSNCFYIWHIAGDLAVVKRKLGFFPKYQCQIDLRQMIVIFVLPVLYLLEHL